MAFAAPPVGYDFNADGFGDYPVSVTGYDPADPVNGAARVWSGASKTILDTIGGTDFNTLFGWSVGSAGDIDDDGFDDLIVGEPLWAPLGAETEYRGRVQVFSGADGSVLLTATGAYLETGLGRYVAGIGDWDGDGTPDIAASGWDIADLDADGIGDDAIGIVFIISGADGSVLAEIYEPTGTELFGYSVFGLGDVTGDGLADVGVVDRGAEAGEGGPGSGAIGQLYIFAGRAQATGSLGAADAHRTIANTDPTLRGFAAHVDTMHPDLWLDEPTLQIISLTAASSSGGGGGPNEAETEITIRKTNGQAVGTKGLRPKLVIAGDVNLDGKVDALDLQVSIAQLGTNPQAMGVMPLADLNGDSVVDTLDVALLLQDYGDETDIYEGLWDGSRLLAVVGANAGFGTIGGAVLSGSATIGGGRRPIDGCHLRDSTPPLLPVLAGTIVDSLLRGDARVNCNNDCPEECWECDDLGSLSGGSVTADPPQPLIGQSFTFTASGVTDSGGTKKCNCGDGSKEVAAVGPGYRWCVVKRNQDGSWPEPPPENAPCWTPGTTTNPIIGTACAEYRAYFRANAARACAPEPIIISGDAEVAEFTLEWENHAATPVNNHRTTVGVGEVTTVRVIEGVSISWEVTIAGSTSMSSGASVTFTAPPEEGSVKVIATGGANNCSRTQDFSVLEPCGVAMTKVGEWHVQGYATSGFCGVPQILPTSVSFTGIEVREGECVGVATDGSSFSGGNGMVHPEGGWFEIGEDNIVLAVDSIRSVADDPNPNPNGYAPGSFHWPIPWEYRCGGGPAKEFAVVHHRETIDAAGTITMSKGGASSTHSVSDGSEICP